MDSREALRTLVQAIPEELQGEETLAASQTLLAAISRSGTDEIEDMVLGTPDTEVFILVFRSHETEILGVYSSMESARGAAEYHASALLEGVAEIVLDYDILRRTLDQDPDNVVPGEN
jgi:hypothetical protein